jgi:hypothetical protein
MLGARMNWWPRSWASLWPDDTKLQAAPSGQGQLVELLKDSNPQSFSNLQFGVDAGAERLIEPARRDEPDTRVSVADGHLPGPYCQCGWLRQIACYCNIGGLDPLMAGIVFLIKSA